MSKLQGEEYDTDAQCVSVQYVINAFFAWLRRRAGSGTTKGLCCRAHKEGNCRNWSVWFEGKEEANVLALFGTGAKLVTAPESFKAVTSA
jgi:hypothetical protein